ncbi:hypothetical protein TrRE_jg3148, partial [Triparma retinervis]
MPLGGDCLLSEPCVEVPGGSGLNLCSHLSNAARLTSASPLTFPLTFHGSLNPDDRMGAVLLRHLDGHGINFVNHNPSSLPTGHCVVVSCPEDRSFYTYRGSVGAFNPSISLPPPPCHLHLGG